MENIPSQLDESAQAVQCEWVCLFIKKSIHTPTKFIIILPEIANPEKCY